MLGKSDFLLGCCGPRSRGPQRCVPILTLILGTAVAVWATEAPRRAQKSLGPDTGTSRSTSPARPPAKSSAPPDSAAGKSSGISSPNELHSLIDQEGRPFSFARLAKKTVVVNFIFTSCPVKCPTQTQALIGLQRALPTAMKARVQFVSLTVDPDRDSASVLKRYATAMGADLSRWSFVTGKQSELNWLYQFYSVGVAAIADGQYDHQMGAYLLDAQGRVMQRYIGDIDKPRLLREIGEVDKLNK